MASYQLSTGFDVLPGTLGPDTYSATPTTLQQGDLLGGTGGHETLVLSEPGTYDLFNATFDVANGSVWHLQGSAGDDTVRIGNWGTLFRFGDVNDDGSLVGGMDGGGGYDILQMVHDETNPFQGFWPLYASEVRNFEEYRGTDQFEFTYFDNTSINSFSKIDGGGGSDAFYGGDFFVITFRGSLDLRGKTFENVGTMQFDHLQVADRSALTVTVDAAQAALLPKMQAGYNGTTLRLDGFLLSPAEAHGLLTRGFSSLLDTSTHVRGNGTPGSDLVRGNTGHDRLAGGRGNDTLKGGMGSDAFVFDASGASNKDTITDFGPGDRIWLDTYVFGELGKQGLPYDPQPIPVSAFRVGPAAADWNDRVIYNPVSGLLSYDPDGNGGAPEAAVAQLAANLSLQASDIYRFSTAPVAHPDP